MGTEEGEIVSRFLQQLQGNFPSDLLTLKLLQPFVRLLMGCIVSRIVQSLLLTSSSQQLPQLPALHPRDYDTAWNRDRKVEFARKVSIYHSEDRLGSPPFRIEPSTLEQSDCVAPYCHTNSIQRTCFQSPNQRMECMFCLFLFNRFVTYWIFGKPMGTFFWCSLVLKISNL